MKVRRSLRNEKTMKIVTRLLGKSGPLRWMGKVNLLSEKDLGCESSKYSLTRGTAAWPQGLPWGMCFGGRGGCARGCPRILSAHVILLGNNRLLARRFDMRCGKGRMSL